MIYKWGLKELFAKELTIFHTGGQNKLCQTLERACAAFTKEECGDDECLGNCADLPPSFTKPVPPPSVSWP